MEQDARGETTMTRFRVTIERNATQQVSFDVEAADEETAEAMTNEIIELGTDKIWSMAYRNAFVEVDGDDWQCIEIQKGDQPPSLPPSWIDDPTDPVLSH
jgi:hypothetical protein